MKSQFFIKIQKIGKPLARLRKTEKTQINKIKYERRILTMDTTEI